MPRFEISNTDDIIDSRDIIERFEELDGERDDLVNAVDDAKGELESSMNDLGTAQHDLYNANSSGDAEAIAEATADCEKYQSAADDADVALKEAEEALATWDGATEWATLKNLCEQGEGCADWSYGETLIHESHFADYAEELAKETSDVPSSQWSQWPFNCIDWEDAANTLKQDYTSIDFDGQTYYVRS